MSLAALVKRYSDYRVKNAQIKVRQKTEREKELRPFLAEIGREVHLARENGHKVTHMADEVTNKNRNFLYDALRAYEEDNVTTPEVATPAPQAEPAGWVDSPFRVALNGNSADVKIYWDGGDENTSLYLSDGLVDDYPEHWVTATGDRKAFYKRIVQEVEREAAKGKPER